MDRALGVKCLSLGYFVLSILDKYMLSCVTLLKKCLQYHEYKVDTKVTLGTSGIIDERPLMKLVGMKTPSIENPIYPQRVGVTKMKSRTKCSS